MSKSRLRRWAWAKTKKVSKKAWRQHRLNADKRRKKRQELLLAQRQALRERAGEVEQTAVDKARSFWSRHYVLADWRDAFAQKGHELLDKRDLRGGIITPEELEALDQFEGPEQWRAAMQERRRALYLEQRRRDRDAEYGPLAMAYGGGQKAGVPTVKHLGFKAPPPRKTKLTKAAATVPPSTWQAPKRRRVRRRDRVATIVEQWKPRMVQNARKAMAADGNLSAAQDAIREFAEQFPESRTQVHDHLGKLGELGKSFSSSMEVMQATLAAGRGEDNPGMPAEVLTHLRPLLEAGATIETAVLATIAAWEDYFRDAIKAAQDEHTPSKQALTS